MNLCGEDISTQSFLPAIVHPSLPRFTESDEPVWRGNLYAVILPSVVQPSLPRFTESDEPVWRGNLYAVILPSVVQPSLPRFTESDEPVWRGNLYAVILSAVVHVQCTTISLGLQSLMSLCGEDTSMWLPSPSLFSPTSSSAANTSWCSGKLVLLHNIFFL